MGRKARLKALGMNGNGAGTPLTVQVRQWATPRAQDSKCQAFPPSSLRWDTLAGDVARETTPKGPPGVLNADWVEVLMGFPPGWTTL